MIPDSRDSAKKEESKEKPDVAMKYANKSGKGYMEDIKEQDSEQENAPTAQKASSSVAEPSPSQILNPGETIQRKISEAQTKKYSLQTQLQRMKDSKSVLDMKQQAMPKGRSATTKSASGYQMYHLLFVGVVAMILGAYVSLTYLKK